MKYQVVFSIVAVLVVLITWEFSTKPFDVWEKAQSVIATMPPVSKCNVLQVCPPTHFALSVRSGAANVAGPKICFDGKIIMSNVLNNVGQGLNIVVVNGENGVVDKFDVFNGNPGDILAYLEKITPGTIVLVASFDDVTAVMTDEVKELFVGLGSTSIKSVNHRESWVFAGRAGTENKSLFENMAVDDQNTNIYDGWPARVEVNGCFKRTTTVQDKATMSFENGRTALQFLFGL